MTSQIYLKPGCTSVMSYFHFIGSEKQSQLRSLASSTFLDQLILQIFLVNIGDTRWYGHNFNQSSSGKVTQWISSNDSELRGVTIYIT